jgi:hypothetical protein
MRLLFLFALCLLLAGCGDPVSTPAGAAAVNIAAVPVFGRTLPDLAVSAVMGRDCSPVHVAQGKPYCTPREPPPPKQPYCTRSLGVVDCWADPADLGRPPPPQVADGPQGLTPEQQRNRTARWPKLLNIGS